MIRRIPFFLLLALPISIFAQDAKIYRNSVLNIQFEHPKDWQVVNGRKNESRILVPVEGAKEPAILEILPVTFESEKDIWLTAQKTVVSNARYDLIRQWEEEILGVPMLLTKYSFPNARGVQIATSGLLYTSWPRKFFWRLTAGTFEFEKAEFALRQVLQTLRTIDGTAFKVLDPNAPKEKGGRKVVPVEATPTKTVVIDAGTGPKPGEETKGEMSFDAKAAGRDVKVYLPKGWGTATTEGGYVLRHPDVDGPVTLQVLSSLDADPSARALFLASSKSLALYATVAERKETLPEPNRAGAQVAYVLRTGKSDKGFQSSWDATVTKGDFYLVLTYASTDKRESERARRVLDDLLRVASIDLVK